MTTRHFLPFRGMAAVACVSVGLLACTEPQPTGPTDHSIVAAKGVNGGGPGPKVKEANPNEAPQDTTLVVRVIGSGFDDGSVAKWLLAGQSTPKVVVNQTTFVDDKNLDADITIALDADVDLYDIEVTTTRGKKGIGSELFSVKQKGAPSDTPVSATFRDAIGDGVTSDTLGAYTDAMILAIGNLFVDARKNTNDRKFCFYFPDQPGLPEDVCDDGYFSTADPGVEGGFLAMDPGSTMTTRAQVTWVRPDDTTGKGYNWYLRFGQDCDLGDVGADRLTVTHALDGVTWVLEGATAILCRMPTKGRPQVELVGTFAMPFELTVVK